MIGSIQEALKGIVYRDAKLPQQEVDVRFATPTRDWVSGINRPTVNFFLYDLVENTRLRAHDMEMRQTSLQSTRRLRPRRMDLKYVVNVFFKSQLNEMDEQEWAILWRVLAALMRNSEWPAEDVPPAVREMGLSVLSSVNQPDHNSRLGELWSGLGTAPRPSLHYVLTVPLDLNVEFLSPLVLQQDVTFTRADTGDVIERRQRYGWLLTRADGTPIPGAEVRLADGVSITTTTDDGEFYLRVSPEEAQHLQVRSSDQADWQDVATNPGDYRVILPE